MSRKGPLKWSVLTLLGALTVVGCRPQGPDMSDTLGTETTVEWAQLKVGQIFRMSPAQQISRCYLPGGGELTLGSCGDQAYWQVVRLSNPYVKIVKSLVNQECLEFGDQNKLKTSACVLSEPVRKKPCPYAGRYPVKSDDCEVPDSGSKKSEPTPHQRQVLTMDGSKLTPAYRETCVGPGPSGRGGVTCTYGLMTGDAKIFSDPVVFSISSRKDDGSIATLPDDQLIYRSDLKMARQESESSSFASEIRWGHIPRITAIYVATDSGTFSKNPNAWITGLQIHYAGGAKELIGNCRLDSQGHCIVNQGSRPNHPNPIRFDPDEHLVAVGMKFGPPSSPVSFPGENRTHDTRLIELMLKTNKSQDQGKPILWQGSGDGSVSWQWLTSKPSAMIAGFFGGTGRLGENRFEKSTIIHKMGVIYAAIDTYKAHHPDTFQKSGGPAAKKAPLSQKDGDHMLGATKANTTFRQFRGQTIRGLTKEGQESHKAYLEFFQDQASQFSSTFFGGALGNGVRTASLRAYFENDLLVALVLHPHGIGGQIQPEVYGRIPPHSSPNFILELGEKESITGIQWKSGLDRAGRTNRSYDQHALNGPLINGLKVITNKNRSAEYSAPGTEDKTWSEGLGRAGYAIVGFHGMATADSMAENLNISGIVNLGAWLVKLSELP